MSRRVNLHAEVDGCQPGLRFAAEPSLVGLCLCISAPTGAAFSRTNQRLKLTYAIIACESLIQCLACILSFGLSGPVPDTSSRDSMPRSGRPATNPFMPQGRTSRRVMFHDKPKFSWSRWLITAHFLQSQIFFYIFDSCDFQPQTRGQATARQYELAALHAQLKLQDAAACVGVQMPAG